MPQHALDIAIGELGVFERTGRNDGVPAEKYMRGDKLAWCAGLMLYCFDVADDPDIWDVGLGPDEGEDSDYWKLRKVSTMRTYVGDRGYGMGHRLVPRPNDLVFFDNRQGSDAGEGSHVGIVENVEHTSLGQIIVHTIEGNVGNKVARVRHLFPTKDIIGFARLLPTPRKYL